MRRAAIVLVVLLTACSSSSAKTAPASTSEPASTAVPSSTLPPGVGPLCDRATLQVVQEAFTYNSEGKVPGSAYGKSRFADLLAVSLNDCASRIEWVTAMEAHLEAPQEGPLDTMLGYGCDKERLGQEIDQAVGVTPSSLPPACV